MSSNRGRRKRRRKTARLWQQETAAAQLEAQLDSAESDLAARQLHVSGIEPGATDSAIAAELGRFGPVAQVQLLPSWKAAAGRFPPPAAAMVEFERAGAKAAALAAMVQVQRDGRGGSFTSAMLPVPSSIGFWRSSSCPLCRGRKGRPCTCQRFCVLGAHRPQRSRAYQQVAGEHCMAAVRLQLGSLGPGGASFVQELDSAAIQITFDLQRRCMGIQVPLGGTQHLLIVAFRHVRRSLQLSSQGRTLSFTVRQPPKVLRKFQASVQSLSEPDWELALDPTRDATPVGAGLGGADGSIGRSFTYVLTLAGAASDALAPRSKLSKRLYSFRLLGAAGCGSPAALPILSAGVCRLHERLQALDWWVGGYQVLALVSSGAASVWQVSEPAFLQLLEECPPGLACAALAELSSSSAPLRDAVGALQRQLDDLSVPGSYVAELPRASDKVPRVLATPTRLKYLQPEASTSNRVIRFFSDPTACHTYGRNELAALEGLLIERSFFLRLSFADESGDKLHYSRDEPVEAFYSRITDVLQNGVVVNGRRYSYLANSSSQLKTWSCWMVADPRQGTPAAWTRVPADGAKQLAQALRLWMGDAMITERVVGKCAARLGQCFSTTVDAAQVLTDEVEHVDDVTRNGHYFSDGVASISAELLREVLLALDVDASSDDRVVSAIQARFQGAKGVWSLNGCLPGRRLTLRPSQIKFGSTHPALEVCSLANWLPAYLNRQVIIMLEHNGVPACVFLESLETQLSDLARMCQSPRDALEVLPGLGGVDSNAAGAMRHMLEVAVALGQPLDPLLDSCLKATARWQVTDLRNKARLLVRRGAVLMGVLDEHNVLDEGEVFVQEQRPGQAQRRIITGDVLLAKHPVAHRGDVRVALAIDPRSRPGGQRLVRDYVNVAVFSSRGERPLPNQLSGSDLDGDLYMLSWDPAFLPPSNCPPMDYSAGPPLKVDTVTVDHLIEHFRSFIVNDNLGAIATWLIAHADKLGADSPECEELAHLHSTAVDFPKTGQPAALDVLRLLPREWPHFMERNGQPSYESHKALGALYDRILKHPLVKCLMAEPEPASLQPQPQPQPQPPPQPQPQPQPLTAAAAGRAWQQLVRSRLGGAAPRVLAAPWPCLLLDAAGGAAAYGPFTPGAATAFGQFENALLSVMNHWGVFNAGQLLTGCLPRLQAHRAQHHQHAEQRDQLSKELRTVFAAARRSFLCLVLQAAGLNGGDSAASTSSTLRQLEGQAAAPGAAPARRAAAAAFLREAHRWTMQQAAAAAQPQQPGQGGQEDSGSDTDSSSADEDEADEGEGEEAAQAHAGRRAKVSELRQLVRLAFGWVVARETRELARELEAGRT